MQSDREKKKEGQVLLWKHTNARGKKMIILNYLPLKKKKTTLRAQYSPNLNTISEREIRAADEILFSIWRGGVAKGLSRVDNIF